MSVKLSICTPTWNRHDFLKQSLRETADQIDKADLWDEVEICVSDNGSTDETPQLIESLRQSYPKVRFATNRFQTNQGYSPNMDAVIRIANGEFIFLNGDDDQFTLGGVKALLKQCQTISTSAIFIQNLGNANKLLDTKALPPNAILHFQSVFDSLRELGPFHPTFIGNFILRKEAYLQHFRQEFLDSIYPHTAILFEILRGTVVEYRNFCCVSVDDSDRHIGFCAARGTAVDVARVQTEGHLIDEPNGKAKFDFYKLFLRSVPRAILNERTGHCSSLQNKYSSTSLHNLLQAYRASTMAKFAVVLLWLIATILPCPILRRVVR